MDPHRDTPPVSDDLSALAWVLEELRKTLESAHKSLRRYLRDSAATAGSDLDDVEPAVLRTARQLIHQGVGALELVNLPEGALLMRSAEQLVQRFVAKPQRLDAAGVEAVEKASFALLDYLGQKLAGRPVQAVALFPQWRALLELNGAERVHPADLWAHDWRWREVPAAGPATPRAADAALLSRFEKALLGLVRQNTPAAAAQLAADCDALAAGAIHAEEATLWRLAAAFFEAWGDGLLAPDMFLKRTASRVMAQIRGRLKGEEGWSERLAQDLLFYDARAWPAPAQPVAPRLRAVHRAYELARAPVVDYNQPVYGLRDPSLVMQARKRVTAAKDAWSAAAAGEAQRGGHLVEPFTLAGESVTRLYGDDGLLARALVAAATATVRAGRPPSPALAMEVATSLLYIEAALDEADFEDAGHAVRARRLAERIERVAAGQPAQPLEPWMEELYRRVSDRVTLGSVVQELRASLLEVERQIDQFFRSPQESGLLAGVPGLLGSMRGVLSVLGIDAAIQTLVRMREDVERLLRADAGPQDPATLGAFQRLAANLGALGFLIDMLSVQPQVAKSLFTFDADLGVLAPVMGRSVVTADVIGRAEAIAQAVRDDAVPLQAVSAELEALQRDAQVSALPGLSARVTSAQTALEHADDEPPAARAQVLQAMQDFVATATAPLGLDPLGPPILERPTAPPAPVEVPAVASTGLEEDDEMREVFLEEAREVLMTAQDALGSLAHDPGNLSLLTQLRRAFHTLKGSARMVGLSAYGEAAWSCEQLYNHWLAAQTPSSPGLRTFTGDALIYFAGWTEAIDRRTGEAFLPDPVMAGAEALRQAGELMRIPLPGAPSGAAMAPPQAGPLDPSRIDLEVPIDDGPARPVMEPLQATRPMDLGGPIWAATEPVRVPPSPAQTLPRHDLIDLPLDFDLDLDEPAESVEPVEPVEPFAPALAAAPGADVDLPLDVAPPVPGLVPAAVAEEMPIAPAPASVLPASWPFDGLEPDDGAIERIEVASQGLDDESHSWRAPLQTTTSAPVTLGGPPSSGAMRPESDLARVEPPMPAIETMDLRAWDEPPAAVAEPQAVPPPSAEVIDLGSFREQTAADVLRAAQPQRDPEADQIKVIGRLRLQIPLFNIYLNEADEVSRRLGTELTVWSMELPAPLGAEAAALAHTLAGNSATVGFTELARLARLLEDALGQVGALQAFEAIDPVDAELFVRAADDIRNLLHQFAAGFLLAPPPTLVDRLEAWIRTAAGRLARHAEQAADPVTQAGVPDEAPVPEAAPAPVSPPTQPPQPVAARPDFEIDADADIDQLDQADPDLFPVFVEEAQELLPLLESQIEAWQQDPSLPGASTACMRTLHTFKGGARLAGAMRLGEMAHRFESAVETLTAGGPIGAAGLALLTQRAEALQAAFEALRQRPVAPPATAPGPAPAAWDPSSMRMTREGLLPSTALGDLAEAPAASARAAARPAPVVLAEGQDPGIDWTAFLAASPAASAAQADRPAPNPQPVRVKAPLLDRLVNLAGEVSITRSRLESEIGQIRGALGDLTDNLERLNQQLHDVTLQADTQLETRKEAARAAAQEFDPLELDRYTRLQELTRMMAESVNDVATVRSALQRTLQTAEDELAVQARLTRELQGDLLRTRMVEFESLSERLYRVVRLAAKEVGRQVRFDIVGGSIEVDRGVLDRMTAAFEHLLRNCVTHGIEPPAQRQAAAKDPTGSIVVSLEQEGNEVSVEIRDDGAGLDLARIRARALEMGLIGPDARLSDKELAHLIFAPGLSTASALTEVAGRGVGMDVVKSDVQAMGGRIEIRTFAGRGTRFKLVLPLTTVVTQVVILRSGARSIAVPSNLVELVQRTPVEQVDAAYREGQYGYGGLMLPFYWLGALLDVGGRSLEMTGRTLPVVIVRSAQQRVALHVDEVLGSHEVVVKNLGPQLSRVPGLAGMTLLASGAVALIYNPVALASVHGGLAQRLMRVQAGVAAADGPGAADVGGPAPEPARPAPLVLVVDDSLTVRRITKRLLEREGYRVALAKDGLEALELLAGERPVVVLSDIEMPRMDGFDLLRNIRGDASLAGLPVIMITSRIAQKHRDIALELGASHYLGKPYSEEDLLRRIAACAAAAAGREAGETRA